MTLSVSSFSACLRLAPLAVASLVLAGCAAMGPAKPEQVVQQRATEYWKARVAAQYEKAYALSTPSYRKLRTAEQFKQKFGAGANIQAAEVVKVSCADEKCTAQMKLSVKPIILGLNLSTMDTFVDETWLLEDGQWWHHQDL